MQARILAARPQLPPQPHDVRERIRAKLQAAVADGSLDMASYGVSKLLRFSKSGPAATISGGSPSHDCAHTLGAHFERSDGAWFTFQITLVGGELDSYSYQFCLADEVSRTFLRFELDAPGKAHESEGLRSHLHPGHNDLRVPAPVLSPLELLDFFLYGLTRDAEAVNGS